MSHKAQKTTWFEVELSSQGAVHTSLLQRSCGEDEGLCCIFLRMSRTLHQIKTSAGASQSQTKGESEGHLYRNLRHRVMEAHVELLRDGLQQHPPERRQKEKEMEANTQLL